MKLHTNTPPRKGLRVASSAALVLAAGLALTGCANPLEKFVESATISAAEELVSGATGADISMGATGELPDNFPSNIPMPDFGPAGVVTQVVDGRDSWIIAYKEGVTKERYEAAVESLLASGFTEEQRLDIGGAMSSAMLTNGEYSVIVQLMGDEDDDRMMNFLVTAEES